MEWLSGRPSALGDSAIAIIAPWLRVVATSMCQVVIKGMRHVVTRACSDQPCGPSTAVWGGKQMWVPSVSLCSASSVVLVPEHMSWPFSFIDPPLPRTRVHLSLLPSSLHPLLLPGVADVRLLNLIGSRNRATPAAPPSPFDEAFGGVDVVAEPGATVKSATPTPLASPFLLPCAVGVLAKSEANASSGTSTSARFIKYFMPAQTIKDFSFSFMSSFVSPAPCLRALPQLLDLLLALLADETQAWAR